MVNECDFLFIGRVSTKAVDKWEHRCSQCGRVVSSPFKDSAKLHFVCLGEAQTSQAAESGLGTEAVDWRERAKADLRAMAERMGAAARPATAIAATLDRCFGGCDKMDTNKGYCTLRGRPCRQRQQWLEHLLFHECDYGR